MSDSWDHPSSSQADDLADARGSDISSYCICFCEAGSGVWLAKADIGDRRGWGLLLGHRSAARFLGFDDRRGVSLGPITAANSGKEARIDSDTDRKEHLTMKKGVALGAQRRKQLNNCRTGRPSHPRDVYVWETDTSPGCG
jgi:hypothetical protein